MDKTLLILKNKKTEDFILVTDAPFREWFLEFARQHESLQSAPEVTTDTKNNGYKIEKLAHKERYN